MTAEEDLLNEIYQTLIAIRACVCAPVSPLGYLMVQEYEPPVWQRFEAYTEGDDATVAFVGSAWRGQSFTPTMPYAINAVSLKVARYGNPEYATVSIRDTENHVPVGSDLAAATRYIGNLPAHPEYTWFDWTLDRAVELEADKEYAIVVRVATADPDHPFDNQMYWRYDNTSSLYVRGYMLSSPNAGEEGSWTAYSGRDHMFETWGSAL